ncbi:MAG: 50S ribosomal protein L19e [Euryarchaeota archaeon]|nr:50S ribosomal protein L19e [Euryarchaeota archaeon]
MNLRNQRRMAAEILKCGIGRVWIDPNDMESLEDAITRADIRIAIHNGTIRKLPVQGQSRARARHRNVQREKGRQRGAGSRKGGRNARDPRKRRWIRTIRSIRATLQELREAGRIDVRTYRRYYRQAKGGMFKGRAHLEQHLRSAGLLKAG